MTFAAAFSAARVAYINFPTNPSLQPDGGMEEGGAEKKKLFPGDGGIEHA